MERMDRRKFLASAAVFGGGAVLAGCGGGAGSQGQPSAGGTPTETHPPIGQEPGTLNILEWPGYEAGGTKAQTYGMLAGTNYTDEFGAKGLKYTYIVNDNPATTYTPPSGSAHATTRTLRKVTVVVRDGTNTNNASGLASFVRCRKGA